MSQSEKTAESSKILDAIRAKRERRTGHVGDIAGLEASLIADIEAFDLNEAERQARREQLASLGGMGSAALAFPEIVPSGAVRNLDSRRVGQGDDGQDPQSIVEGSSLLGQLRRQAAVRQRELHTELAERSASNNALEQTLKYMFFYLHDLVQQLNIVKPAIPRDFVLLEKYAINQLVWQEGFADYRTQSQSAGALVELVTFSCRLSGNGVPMIEKEGPAIERFRRILFDYGLPFTCKEFKNERSYVERAEFEVGGEVSVSARWRADFSKGVLVLETRNLERLGSALFTIHPQFVDYALLDDFGRLILGQANHFRELVRRE